MKIKVNAGDTRRYINKVQADLQKLPDEAYKHFVSVTPIRSGNARSKTRKSGNTIHASYAYAQRLDDGYSKQAPKGMIEPTEQFIQKRINEITRK
jgi:hypothetical protein